VVQRHEILHDFFIKILAVNEADVMKQAVKWKWVSPIILDRITQFIQFLEKCPRGGRGWLEKIGTYANRGRH
jgi:DtxR family Mn-dependent transcriptional regulator